MFRQQFDGRVIPCERGRKFFIEENLQITGQADSLHRTQPIIRERLARVDGCRLHFEHGCNVRDKPGSNFHWRIRHLSNSLTG